MQRFDFEAMMREAEARAARGVRICRCGAEMALSMRLCRACDERERREARERARERAIADVERSIPPVLRWARFDAPELRQRVDPIRAIELAKTALSAPSVVLVGDAGSGKSSLAVAMLRAHAERGDRGIFVDSRALVRARVAHRMGEGEADLVSRAMRAPVLVLDELGAEIGKGTAESVVAEVIHERHAWQRRTIYTTPFTAADLTARYGAGIVRRIVEGADLIRLRGAS